MTVHHVAVDNHLHPDRHAAWLELSAATVADDTVVPVTLYTDTRRGVGPALGEMLLFAGRAQPVISAQTRMTRRDEAYRAQVALAATGQDLVIHAAEHLHQGDAQLLAHVAVAASVDLWLVTCGQVRPALAARLAELAGGNVVPVDDALRRFRARPGAGRRAHPSACEATLPIGAGVAPGCASHDDAAGCALSCFGHALVTARTTPAAVRARLHELTRTLPDDRAWAVYAAARDPWRYADAAAHTLPLSGRELRDMRINALAADGSRIALADRTVLVPAHLRGVLAAHRAIRIAEGSTGRSRLLIPTDDGHRRPLPRVA